MEIAGGGQEWAEDEVFRKWRQLARLVVEAVSPDPVRVRVGGGPAVRGTGDVERCKDSHLHCVFVGQIEHAFTHVGNETIAGV